MEAAYSLRSQVVAEFLGTATLLCAVVGSGIMATQLFQGNVGLSLLANAIATGAILLVLIASFAPISGAHFNPVVTALARIKSAETTASMVAKIFAQFGGAVAGVLLSHALFSLPILQASTHTRSSLPLCLSEVVATEGLVLTIELVSRHEPAKVSSAVALYIVSAYWFTPSTSFANPAATVARALTNTFAGIRSGSVLLFIAGQVLGAALGYALSLLFAREQRGAGGSKIDRESS